MSSWKWFAVFVLATTAVIVSAGPIDECVLQKNTADKRFELSTLDRLLGESLTTKSNGNFYIVSICRPISQKHRKLAGAMKITSDGYSIDLGRIDQSDIIVNENSIVLTYVGGDEDRDPRDTCKGQRWTTYLAFVCDPFSTSDILTLINEDPDQPEICQVWFEIRTSKTCIHQSNEPLNILGKDLNSQNKLLNNDIDGEIIYSNHILNYGKSSTVENNKSDVTKNSLYIMLEDNNTNRSNSHNTSFENKSFVINSHIINEKENSDKEKKGDNSDQNKFEDMLNNKKKNFSTVNEFLNTKIENNNLNQNYSHKIDIEKKLLITNTITNYLNRKKIINNKKNESTLNNYIYEEKLPNSQTNYFSINKKYPNAETEKMYMHQKNIQNDHFKDKPSVNENMNNENTTISLKEKNDFKNFDNEINYIKKINKSMNEEKLKNGNLIQGISKVQLFENKKLVVNDNNLNPQNIHNNKTYNELFSNSDNRIIIINDEQKNISNKNKSQNTKYNDYMKDFNKENKLTNEHRMKDGNLTQINSKVQLFEKSIINETNLNEKNILINKSSIDTNFNTTKENKTINNENVKTENSKNINFKDKSTINDLNNEIKSTSIENKNDNINKNTSEYNSNNNTNYLEKNKSVLNNISEEENSSKNDTLYTTTEYIKSNNKYENLGNNSKNANLNKTISKVMYNEKNNSSVSTSENENNFNQTDSQNYNLKISEKDGKSINDKNKNYSGSNQNDLKDKFSNNEYIKSIKNDKLANNKTEEINLLANKYSNKESNILNILSKVNNSLSNSTQHDDYEEKPSSSTDVMSKKNYTSIENGVNNQTENKSANINEYNSSIDSNNSTAINIKSSTNSLSNTTDYLNSTNLSTETQNSQDNEPVEELLNKNNKNDNSEFNSTSVNVINNGEKKIQAEQSNQNTENNKYGSIDNTDQSKDDSNSGGFFAKLFPNGIQLNAATIFTALGSLSGISVLVGAAVNRYYYKLSGTDQIPCKGTFQNIYGNLKGHISKILCCCRDLETFNITNEKTPLLQPQNLTKSLVQEDTSQKYDSSSDEKKQRKTENDGNDINEQKNKYGSMSNESHSIASDEIFSKSKNADINSSNSDSRDQNGDNDKHIKTENNVQKKSITDIVDEKMNNIFNTKVIPNIDDIFKKVGKCAEKEEKEEKKENIIQNAIKDVKSSVNFDKEKAQDKLETSSSYLGNLEKTLINKLETSLTGSHNENKEEKPKYVIKSKNTNESDSIFIPKEKNNEDTNAKVVLPDVQIPLNDEINKLEQELVNKSMDSKLTSEGNKTNKLETENKSGEVKIENIIDENTKTKQIKFEDFEPIPPIVDIKTKINESKLKFLGLKETEENEILNEFKVFDNNQVEEKDDDSIEVIEEIIYVDDVDGLEDGDEIIEEIIETTTVSPETGENSKSLQSSDANEGHTTVSTVRKTSIRKSSAPDDVILLEETVLDGNILQNEKKPSGIQFGIGKSGLNMSVGDKKLGIGKSGVKFGKREEQGNENDVMTIKLDKSGLKLNRNKSKMFNNDESEEVDKFENLDLTSPEKVKKSKSIPNFKIFKRSISHPTESDIQEVDEVVPKKVSRNASNLLKFRKSRSKSTSVLTTDVHALSNFIDHERYASQINLNESEKNDKKVVERKMSLSSPLLSSSETEMPYSGFTLKNDGKKHSISDKNTTLSSNVNVIAGTSAENLKVEDNKNKKSSKNANKKSKFKRGK